MHSHRAYLGEMSTISTFRRRDHVRFLYMAPGTKWAGKIQISEIIYLWWADTAGFIVLALSKCNCHSLTMSKYRHVVTVFPHVENCTWLRCTDPFLWTKCSFLVNGQTEFASVGVKSGILDTQFTAAILMFCLPSLPPCSGDRDV